MESSARLILLLVIVLPIGLLIGAVILRAAVAFYNKMAGTGTQVAQANVAGYSPNVAGRPDSANPFAAPATYGSPPSLSQTGGVPEPGFGRACGTVFVTCLANLPFSVISKVLVRLAPETAMLLSVISLPIHFVISAAVLKSMLPTQRFGTACLIELFQFLIVLIIAVVLAVILGVVWFAAHS